MKEGQRGEEEGDGRGRRGRRRGRGVLAIRRHSNGVFQFAVAGNERRLKPGQLFCPKRRRLKGKRKRERWRVALNRPDR